MRRLPTSIMTRLDPFAPVFSRRVWRHVPTLVGGAILAPGRRMVSSTLRVMGLGRCAAFSTYHRVLNRAVWSRLRASRILRGLLVAAFVPEGPLVVGLDAPLERRRGPQSAAAGIYRDPVRSSHSHVVKARALRWVSMLVLVPIPGAGRTWALPFLTARAPSERYTQERGRRHTAVPRWAQQMIRALHRWYPDRPLVIVGDQDDAVIELLAATRHVAPLVTRLRLDARLFDPPPPRQPHDKGRPPGVGRRLPNLAVRAVDPTTPWATVSVPRWDGEDARAIEIEIVSGTALWYHGGKPPVLIRWVLIRSEMHRLLEDQAHAFAGAFLLPSASFLRDLPAPTLDACRAMKAKWGVSIKAMMYRLKALGILSDDEARAMFISYSRRGWRKHEPLDSELEPEQPRALAQAITLLVDENIVTKDQLIADLALSPMDIEQLAGLPTGYLEDMPPLVRLLDRSHHHAGGRVQRATGLSEVIDFTSRE